MEVLKLNDQLKSQESYVYGLKLEDAYVNYFIKGNVNVDNMKDLIFYIQYKYYDILSQPLTLLDLKQILRNCYGIESTYVIEADEIIDLDLNFKENFNKEKIDYIINNFKLYEVKGLAGELRKIANLTIEQWRCR